MVDTIFILILITLNILATRKIFKYPLMDLKSKWRNYFLIWLIPLIWACIILLFPFEPRKKDKNFEKNQYMESGYQNLMVHDT
jgi:hypothetical protein